MDKKRRAMVRLIRKKLKLTQSELAALAGISQQTLARFERGKHVSLSVEDRVTGAIIRTAAKQNPDAMNRATRPVLEAAEKWEKVLSLEPGSEVAQELERLSGMSLAELKTRAETMASFLRKGADIALSLTK